MFAIQYLTFIIIVMRCAVWYHLHNLENLKNTHGGVLLLVTLLHGCFSRFLNGVNGTKLRKASHMVLSQYRFHLNQDYLI